MRATRSRTLALAGSAVVALAAADARAQDAPSAPRGDGPSVTLAGTVFDSLAGAPLAGALVWVGDAGRDGITDSLGRFRLDLPRPGRWALTVSHAALDSVGLYGVGATVDVPDSGATEARVAVPSLATLWARVCGDDAPPDARAGIVSGRVTRAGDGAPAAGATVQLEWLAIDTIDGRLSVRRPSLQAQAGPDGSYYVCGVRAGRELEVTAATDDAASGTIFAAVGARRLARVDLVVAPMAAGARREATATVAGVVRIDTGHPHAGARVRIVGEEREVRTDEQGRFRLPQVPAGSRTLQVIALGYEPVYLTITPRAGAETSLDVTLRPATTLEPVRITARMVRQLEDFERRRKLGFGTFLTSEELANRQVLRSVFEEFAGLRVVGNAVDWVVLGTSAGGLQCQLSVMIDGRTATWEELRTYRPEHITAMEVYPRYFSAPLEVLPPSSDRCGAVLVWTTIR